MSLEEIEFDLKNLLVEGNLLRLKTAGFEKACIEAEHLGIEKKGVPFRKLVEINIACMLEAGLEALRYSQKEDNDPPGKFLYSLDPPDKDSMKRGILDKYRSKRLGDILVEHPIQYEWRKHFQELQIDCRRAYGWGDKLNDEGHKVG